MATSLSIPVYTSQPAPVAGVKRQRMANRQPKTVEQKNQQKKDFEIFKFKASPSYLHVLCFGTTITGLPKFKTYLEDIAGVEVICGEIVEIKQRTSGENLRLTCICKVAPNLKWGEVSKMLGARFAVLKSNKTMFWYFSGDSFNQYATFSWRFSTSS